MPDITMCNDAECEMREKCYRYTAKPDEYRQAFAETLRITKEDGTLEEGCEYF